MGTTDIHIALNGKAAWVWMNARVAFDRVSPKVYNDCMFGDPSFVGIPRGGLITSMHSAIYPAELESTEAAVDGDYAEQSMLPQRVWTVLSKNILISLIISMIILACMSPCK